MSNTYHIPAMLRETIDGLAIRPDGVYVDVTFGGGGHSRAIMSQLGPHGKLFSFDQDMDAYRNEEKRAKTKAACGDDKAPVGKEIDKAESVEKNIPAGEKSNPKSTKQSSNGGENSKLLNGEKELSEEDKAPVGGDRVLLGDERWQFVHGNFRYLNNFLDYYGVTEIDGLLADLGVSFHHFDEAERGFSFRYTGPLDMRMNQAAGRTAADLLNTYSEEELARVFYLYGEMRNARQVAKAIVREREKNPIVRTEQLVALLLRKEPKIENGEIEVPTTEKKDMARLFQALRMEVNDELGALREMLVAARDLLRPDGRIAILTYHSLEDRLVKNFLRSGNIEGNIEKDFYGNILTPFRIIEKGLTATEEEVERNPRSRSAKLRVAQKIAAQPWTKE